MDNNLKKEKLSESLNTLSPQDIYFMTIAEGGAMGDGGGVNIYSVENKKIVHRYGNYHYGDLNMDEVVKAISALNDFNFEQRGAFGEWHHEGMGSGNHLLVKDSVFEKFMQKYNESKSAQKGLVNKIFAKITPDPMLLYISHVSIIMYVLQDIIDKQSDL